MIENEEEFLFDLAVEQPGLAREHFLVRELAEKVLRQRTDEELGRHVRLFLERVTQQHLRLVNQMRHDLPPNQRWRNLVSREWQMGLIALLAIGADYYAKDPEPIL